MSDTIHYQHQCLIYENYLDVFGHMNNATYLDLFEHARWDILNQNGFDLQTIRSLQQGPVILETHIRYLKEIKARDLITIESYVISYEGKVCQLKQVMLKQQTPACEAIFTIALFDLQKRKIIQPTPIWLRALGVPGLE